MEIQFKKVHTAKDLIISALVLAVGVGLYFVNAGLGVFIGACGILMLLFYKAAFKKVGNDTILTKKAIDVASSCRSSLLDYLNGKDVDPGIQQPGAGGVIRLEVYFNKDAGVAYAQLFNFSNYTYEAATEMVELHSPKADKLIDKL
ncbi:MAG: hypothetical protein IJK05_08900 [Bacteroidales bacterium]|nr:hypothetical protein [Bacteroidales bacterium]